MLLELRPRYNHIEESDKSATTEVVTLRAVAGWRFAPHEDWRVTAELLHATHAGARRFNDSLAAIGTSPYPLLPDPRYTGANRLHVDYTGLPDTRIRVGRQVVRLDNQRFVSDNDFRQIPTLFDGATVRYDGLGDIALFAGSMRRVRNAFGDVNDLKLSLLHAAWAPRPGHALAAFAYFHDQARTSSNTGFASNAHRIVGVRAEGALPAFAGFEALYLVELARQGAIGQGDARIDAAYRRVGAGLGNAGLTVRYDHEVKGSNGGAYGFQTPLTDLYAFNGWALRFTTTPREGLVDRWATLRGQVGRVVFFAEHHRFGADAGSRHLGRELDVGVTVTLLDNLVVRLQHARYRPGSIPAPTVDKTWLTFTYTP